MKNSSGIIGNRTRDLLACSAVPQSTPPPRTYSFVTDAIKSQQSTASLNGIPSKNIEITRHSQGQLFCYLVGCVHWDVFGPLRSSSGNTKCIQNFVCFILGNSPASEFYVPTFRNTLFHLCRPMKMEQSVPKRRHITFRRRGITQKKAYNIRNTAKV